MPSLTIISGELAGTAIEITGELTIGRLDAGLTLDDAQVSRRHAVVRPVGDALQVEDLGSSNGTFVNGVRIEGPTMLGQGGKLTIGTTEMVAQYETSRETRRAAPVVDPRTTTRLTKVDPGLTSVVTPPPPTSPASAVPSAASAAALPPDDELKPPRSSLASPPLIALLALVAVAAIALVIFLATSGGSSKTKLIDVPVRFTVSDVNTSLLGCPATNRTYEVAGRLVVPSSASRSAVTLYLSGVIFSGMFEFHNDLVPGYDFSREMAAQGQASVVIDRVGYGQTVPYPSDGVGVCLGAQADMVHQIVGALRSGRYSVSGPSQVHPSAFTRVALAGYSIGGLITEVEAASFADVNGVILMSWADQGFSAYGTSFPYVIAHCNPGLAKPPGGLKGYLQVLPPEKVPPLVSPQADPKIVSLFARNQELDACGQELSGGQWFAGLVNTARARIGVPVLIIYGNNDVLFNPDAWQQQYAKFTGTPDRTQIGIPDGQMLMLDRHAPLTRSKMAAWLDSRGL